MSPLLRLLFLSLLCVIDSAAAAAGPIELELTHVDAVYTTGHSGSGELIQRAILRGKRRLSSAPAAPALHAGLSEYVIELAVGTPPVAVTAVVDTGSDLVWTQCEPCAICYYRRGPIFDPAKSATFARVPCTGELCAALDHSPCDDNSFAVCRYTYTYADSSYTAGELAVETFAIGSTAATVTFGCGSSNNGVGFTEAGGFVGLGRGKLSLVSQLGIERFSYCLTPFGSPKKSSLLLGSTPPSANTNSSSPPLLSTPMLRNSFRPSFYYVALNGITVGTTLVDIPSSIFAIRSDGNGGMIIDSGTFVTFLDYVAFDRVEAAFAAQIKNLSYTDDSLFDLDLCYELPAAGSWTPETLGLPRLVFHFEGGDLELPPANYFGMDSVTSSVCLMMAASRGISVFGNFQQQNMMVTYDLVHEMISIQKSAEC